MAFLTKEFNEACHELVEFSTDGWEKITECQGFIFYRRGGQVQSKNDNSSLFEYKTMGTFPDVSPDICSRSFNDIDYWKSWDEYVVALEEVDNHGEKYLYWRSKYPTPLSDRDVLLKKERCVEYGGQTFWVTLTKSAPQGALPAVPSVVRVDDYWDVAAVTSDGGAGTKLYVRSYDDPKGFIPNFIINWFIKTGLPDYMAQVHESCLNYVNYIAEKR